MTLPTIRFSYNWNNKLNCTAFTTIRLHNPIKYKVNQEYIIELDGKKKQYSAIVKSISIFKLKQLNEFMAHIDTGYSMNETKEILMKMYKNKSIDWDHQRLDLILLTYTNSNIFQQLNLLP